MTQRKQFSSVEKAKVALEMLKEQQTVNQICSTHGVHPTQAAVWKKKAKEILEVGFSDKRGKTQLEYDLEEQKKKTDDLFRQIGQLSVENDWLKKKLGLTRS